MKVLVTGGAGFIGSSVARALIERGDEVYIVDNFSHSSFKNIFGLKCELICSDILDDALYGKLPSVDAVIHEAAITDTTLEDDTKMVMVNYNGFKKVLAWCLKNKVRLIYASSAGVYGTGPSPMKESQAPKPLNTYAYSKYLCDREVIKLRGDVAVPIVGLRYFNVYGPGETHKGSSSSMIFQLYLQMKQGRQPRVFKYGEQKRDFILVDDVAAATIGALALNESVIMNVGTGNARSFNDIIGVLNSVLGEKLAPDYFDNPYANTYQDYTEADISLLKETLNFEPHYTLEQGIERYIRTCHNVSQK